MKTAKSSPLASYDVIPLDERGSRLDDPIKDIAFLQYTRATNRVGECALRVPLTSEGKFRFPWGMVAIYRRPPHGHATVFEGVYFLLDRNRHGRGKTGVSTFNGPDFKHILTGREIDYNPGSAETIKVAPTDDFMKALVRENMGALATDTARDLTPYGVTVTDDQSLGHSYSPPDLSRQDLLTALQDACRWSGTTSKPFFFDFELLALDQLPPLWPLAIQFTTYIHFIGQDRSSTTEAPVILSTNLGNLAEPDLDESYRGVETHIRAIGEGVESGVKTLYAQDTRRLIGPYARREGSVNIPHETSLTKIGARAVMRNYATRPVKVFSGQIVENEHTRYGDAWGFGYKLTAQEWDMSFDVRVDTVTVTVDESGERIEGQLEHVAY